MYGREGIRGQDSESTSSEFAPTSSYLLIIMITNYHPFRRSVYGVDDVLEFAVRVPVKCSDGSIKYPTFNSCHEITNDPGIVMLVIE